MYGTKIFTFRYKFLHTLRKKIIEHQEQAFGINQKLPKSMIDPLLLLKMFFFIFCTEFVLDIKVKALIAMIQTVSLNIFKKQVIEYNVYTYKRRNTIWQIKWVGTPCKF